MSKIKHADLEAEIRRLSNQNAVLHRALNAVLNQELESAVSFRAKNVVPDEPGRYTFRFFDQDSPSGGRVIVTYATPGQQDYSVVYSVDEQRDIIRRDPSCAWSRIFCYAMTHRRRKSTASITDE